MADEHSPPSNLPMYLGLVFFAGLLLTCFASVLGAAIVYLFAVLGTVAVLGGLHYWLWGKGMGEGNTDKPE